MGFEVVFARQIAALGTRNDMVVALSTSGGSENLLRALDEANRHGLLTVGFAGYDGGRMAEAGRVDHLFVVPSASVHRIQEAQTTVYHVLWELTRDRAARRTVGAQQIRGSGSPTSMSTIRVPPNVVFSRTRPGGSSRTCPTSAAPSPSG